MMKKVVFFGFMASMLVASGAALAAGATLTTQEYVDKGLRTLYSVVDNAKADKTDLEAKADASDVYTKEEADAAFLTSASIEGKADADSVYSKDDADEKFATKEDLQGIETETYTAAEKGGLTISEDNAIGLDIDQPVTNAMYVYQNGEWTTLDVSGTFPDNYNFAAQ